MKYKLYIFMILMVTAACSKEQQSPKYIVVFKSDHVEEDAVEDAANDLAQANSISEPKKVFSRTVRAGVYELNEEQARALASDPRVAYIEKDQIYRVNFTQPNATWGLDRIDQKSLPLNRSYSHDPSGAQVNAYVIDTGILTSHRDFNGRAFNGVDMVDHDQEGLDCNGHGTHVAGTIGSSTYGVAKTVKLWAVRVLDCEGSGTTADVIAGIEWVTRNHIKPAVANMSLGGGPSRAIDDAINASIRAGVTYVVAAGNENTNACDGSPARVPNAITVGASTSSDRRASFSNYGRCVDLFAPGQDITSLWFSANNAINMISGTSMASPHAAGVAALYLAQRPFAKPSEVTTALKNGAVSGRLASVGSGSPNLLLNTLFLK